MLPLSGRGPRILIHVLALFPLAALVWGFALGHLGANPIREMQRTSGKYALILLLLTLACTPLSAVPRLKWVSTLRRTLGLYTFVYASLHFLNFVGLDYGFKLDLIREDIFEKRYAVVGFAAFLCLVPLAVTSTRRWMKRLGRNWERLHRLVYLVGLLAIVHFALQDKAGTRRPLFYGIVMVVLLLLRLAPRIGKTLSRLRRWSADPS